MMNNADHHLRREPAAVEFVKTFFQSGKPVAVICHGPQMLSDADVDNGLVTSRSPDDLPAFNAKMIEEIADGIYPRRPATVAV
jgi:protease I